MYNIYIYTYICIIYHTCVLGFAAAMGKPLDAKLITAYAESFRNIPVLKTRGFSLLINTSGKLFVNSRPSLKDVDANTEVHVTKMVYMCFTDNIPLFFGEGMFVNLEAKVFVGTV